VPQPARLVRVYDVYEIAGGTVLQVFRVVKTDDRDDPAFIESFMSHYELGRPPRRLEIGFTVIYMGVSCWRSRNGAVGLAQAFPKIGAHVARLELRQGNGFNVAATSGQDHLTVWGDPVKLAGAVADVTPV
jgi:hypothetical protein